MRSIFASNVHTSAPVAGVQRDYLAERGADIQPAVEVDRRRLERQRLAGGGVLAQLAGAIRPGHLQARTFSRVNCLSVE